MKTTTVLQSVESTLWHFIPSTLTASLKRMSGGSCPVVSTVKMKWLLLFSTLTFSSHPGSPGQRPHALQAKVAPPLVHNLDALFALLAPVLIEPPIAVVIEVKVVALLHENLRVLAVEEIFTDELNLGHHLVPGGAHRRPLGVFLALSFRAVRLELDLLPGDHLAQQDVVVDGGDLVGIVVAVQRYHLLARGRRVRHCLVVLFLQVLRLRLRERGELGLLVGREFASLWQPHEFVRVHVLVHQRSLGAVVGLLAVAPDVHLEHDGVALVVRLALGFVLEQPRVRADGD
jgi:hypothetical protein